MPNYEYECSSCGRLVERSCRYSDRDNNPPHCCGRSTRRIISAPRVVIFTPYVHHNIAPHPVQINSRKQETEEFKKRGLNNVRTR